MVIFLNSLYKMFDARMERYDICKITISNDLFLVVSGVPSTPSGGDDMGDRYVYFNHPICIVISAVQPILMTPEYNFPRSNIIV